MDIEERFLRYVQKTDGGCWIWTGALVKGYGQFQESSYKTVRAHRWAYEHWVGPIPTGRTLDHVCHDPQLCVGGPDCPHRRCVNPDHLQPKTNGENARRGQNSAKTHCKWGHPLSGDNVITKPSRPTRRECRACNYRRTNARQRWKNK